MNAQQPVAARARTRIRITLTSPGARGAGVVLSAAMQLFGPDDPVDVLICVAGVDEVDEALGGRLQRLCLAAGSRPEALPETVLLGEREIAGVEVGADVVAGDDDAENARSIAVLTTVSRRLRTTDVPAQPRSATGVDPAVLRTVLAQRDRALAATAVARRDVPAALAIERGLRRPRVVLLFQHRHYWSAVADIAAALFTRTDIDFEVVALDSAADGRGESTARFLAGQGYAPRGVPWLLDNLADVDALVLDNPYDEMRPLTLAVPNLAAAGVRLVALPYGNNAIGGDPMAKLLWDLPLQRLAWRSYLGSDTQRELYARHCTAGADPVRVLGSPKLDRVRAGAESPWSRRLRSNAGRRPIVLWNPHFRVADGGWSTFDRYLGPLLQYAAAHRDLVLVVRPHFRLFPDLAAMGGPAAEVEETLRAFCRRHRNVVLDENPDYLPTFSAADAMISDLSSLATEWLATGKPVLYLHRGDGPGPNDEGGYFDAMERAEDWPQVAGFLDRVRAGGDPGDAASRAAALEAHFGRLDGQAAHRIVADLVGSLRSDLGLPAGGAEAEPAVAGPAATGAGATGPLLRVRRVRLAAGRLELALEPVTDGGPVRLQLRSARGSSPEVTASSGATGVVLALTRSDEDGVLRPLPCSTYTLVATADSGPVRLHLAPAVLSRTDCRPVVHGPVQASLAIGGVDTVTVTLATVEPVDRQYETKVMAGHYPAARETALRDDVLFSSYQGGPGACNPLAIQRELLRIGHDATQYWVVRDPSVPTPPGTVPLLFGSAEYYRRAATARWLVDNEAMPFFLRKRPEQVLLQTWHGTPLKKLRWDIDEIAPRDRSWMAQYDRDAAQWDVVLSPNPLTSEVLRRAFRVQGEVLESGYPRNDVLADPVRRERAAAATRARLGVPEGHRVLLYAPTWRDDAIRRRGREVSYQPQPLPDFDGMRRALGPDLTILVRRHRYLGDVEHRLPAGVLDVSHHPDMADLLAATDILVTDYSSSLFDFALTGRPMVFFAYDLDRYRHQVRGFYVDVHETLPGPVVTDNAGLVEALADLPGTTARYADRYVPFTDRFGPWDDGAAAARVVQRVFG